MIPKCMSGYSVAWTWSTELISSRMIVFEWMVEILVTILKESNKTKSNSWCILFIALKDKVLIVYIIDAAVPNNPAYPVWQLRVTVGIAK